MVTDDLLGTLIAHIQKFFGLRINERGDTLGVLPALTKLHAHKDFLVTSKVHGSDLVAHAVLCNHLPAHFCRRLKIRRRTGIDFAQDHFFCSMSAQRHRNHINELRTAHIVMFLRRKRQRMSCTPASGNNGYEMHFIASIQHMPDDRVSGFMDSHHSSVLFRNLMAVLFRPHLHAGDGVNQRLLIDLLLSCARGENSRFIHDIL